MQKLKNFISEKLSKKSLKYKYGDLTLEIKNLFTTEAVYILIGFIIALASIPAFWNWKLTLILLFADICLLISVFLKLYSFLSGDIIFIEGKVTDKYSKKRSHTFTLLFDGSIYQVFTDQKKFNTLNIGNTVRIYLRAGETLNQNMDTYTIKYPIHIFQIKNES